MAVTLYWIVQADATATPTGAQIVAGQDGTGATALASGSEAYTAAGDYSEASPITGRTAGAAYEQAWVAYDGSTYSSVETSTIRAAYLLSAAGGTFAYTGGAAGLSFNRVLSAAGGTFANTGGNATLTYTPVSGDDYTLSAAGGTFSYSSEATGLAFNRALIAASGTFSYAGGDARLARGLVLSAAGGTFSYSGGDATFVFQQAPAGFPVVLSLPTFVPGSITNTGARGRVTATAA